MSMSRWYALVNGRLRAGGARFLILVLLALILFDLAAPSPMKPALAATNPIVTENQQPGTGAWLIGSQQSTDATGQIKATPRRPAFIRTRESLSPSRPTLRRHTRSTSIASVGTAAWGAAFVFTSARSTARRSQRARPTPTRD